MSTKPIVVDTDIHPALSAERMLDFLPEPWKRRYARGSRAPGLPGYWNPHGVTRADATMADGSQIDSDPKLLVEQFFDRYGITYGILNVTSALATAVSPELDYANVQLAAMNNVLVEDWLSVDTRLKASLVVSPYDPEFAVREIHRLGDHPGIVQVLLPSAADTPYGHRRFHAIYAAAVEHNLPIAIHPGSEGAGMSGTPTSVGYPGGYFEWHTNLATGYISHIVSLAIEGVFQKFPRLRFVMLEGGVCWLPPMLWRLDKNWKALRETAPWLTRPPSQIISEHALLATQPLEEPENPEHFRQMMDMFDAERMIMFSSDYPHWDGDTPDFVGKAFRPEMRQRILGENALELYALPRLEVAHANA